MGRYSTDLNSSTPTNNQNGDTPPFFNQYNQSAPNTSSAVSCWPQVFPKPIIGIDLNGTIIEDKIINNIENIIPLDSALNAIRTLRLKGYKVGILSDQPLITSGQLSVQDMTNAIQHLMLLFGNAGIYSIDGILYNTSSIPQDEYAKPNTGMIKRMENESGGKIDFKKGWYVGDSIDDLKMAAKAGAKPVLVLTGNGQNTLKELDRNSNKNLKKNTLVFSNLLDFANSI